MSMYGRDTMAQNAYQQDQMAEKMRYSALQDAQSGQSILGQMKAQQIASPHGPLESAMDSLSNGLQEAFSALDRLSEGLHLVLQPEMPTPTGVNNATAPLPTSPAVSRLHSLRDGLEALTSRMNALRCRLDS
jgi:hypothetical protein